MLSIDRTDRQIINLNTTQVQNREAINYWNDYVCDSFVEVDVEVPNDEAFSGSIQGCRLKNDLQISKVEAKPHHVTRTKSQISKSSTDFYLIGLQLEGRGMIRQEGRESILKPNDWAIYDSTRPYELLFDKDFKHLVIHFPKALLPLVPESYQNTAVRFDGSSGYGKILSNLFSVSEHEMYALTESELSRLSNTMLDMLSHFLISNLKELKNDKNFVLEESKTFIQKNLYNSNVNSKSISSELNCSLRTLQYAFQKEGVTVSEYIKHERLKKVERLLSNPSYDYYSISQMAYLVGFKSASHFSTVFTKKFMISPSCYRMCRGVLS